MDGRGAAGTAGCGTFGTADHPRSDKHPQQPRMIHVDDFDRDTERGVCFLKTKHFILRLLAQQLDNDKHDPQGQRGFGGRGWGGEGGMVGEEG